LSEAREWNERYGESDRLWIPDADPSLKKAVADLAPTDALDLGCGEGRNALFLARAGFRVTAVDFADVALDRLHAVAANEGLTIETICEDMFAYLALPHTFNFVVLANIHPPRQERLYLYQHLNRIVAPAGWLYIIGHHVDSFGIAGPPNKDLLIDEEEIRTSFPGFVVHTLTKVSDVGDHGHAAPSLVAVLQRPDQSID
jgi:SAM-dependent methyltransferase